MAAIEQEHGFVKHTHKKIWCLGHARQGAIKSFKTEADLALDTKSSALGV